MPLLRSQVKLLLGVKGFFLLKDCDRQHRISGPVIEMALPLTVGVGGAARFAVELSDELLKIL